MLSSFLNSLSLGWIQISPLLGNLIAALLLILLGLAVAKLLSFVVVLGLKALLFDQGAVMIGLNGVLEKGEVKQTAAELIGSLVYWVTIVVVVMAIANVFGLGSQAALLSIMAYTGVVFLVAIVFGLGLLLASLISGIVKAVLLNFGLNGARTASRVIYYIVIIVAFMAALMELGFDAKLLQPHLGIILGMPALAAAIAFGLGCKDMAADFLHNLFRGR